MTAELTDGSYYEQSVRDDNNVEEDHIVVFIFWLQVIKVNCDGLVCAWIALLLISQTRQPLFWKIYHALGHKNVEQIEADY